MSRYLADRIEATPNITVLCDTEVVELQGAPDQGLQGMRWRNRRTGAEEQRAVSHLFLFTGADPAAGSGLRGLDDRVQAFGGSLQVISHQGHGTRILAELPLRS